MLTLQSFSRAHTVVELTLTQKIKAGGANITKTSVVNLVDLAGRYNYCLSCFVVFAILFQGIIEKNDNTILSLDPSYPQ